MPPPIKINGKVSRTLVTLNLTEVKVTAVHTCYFQSMIDPHPRLKFPRHASDRTLVDADGTLFTLSDQNVMIDDKLDQNVMIDGKFLGVDVHVKEKVRFVKLDEPDVTFDGVRLHSTRKNAVLDVYKTNSLDVFLVSENSDTNQKWALVRDTSMETRDVRRLSDELRDVLQSPSDTKSRARMLGVQIR